MQNNSLYLPGFHLSTLRRKPRSSAQKLADEVARIRRHSISQLGDCFGHVIPAKTLANEATGAFSRRRLFSKETPSGRFLSDSGCRWWFAKKWFARFKPLLRHDQCPCPRPPHRRTAKREASSTQLNWNRFSRIPPPTYSNEAEVVGGKIAVSSWSTVPGSAWLLRQVTQP